MDVDVAKIGRKPETVRSALRKAITTMGVQDKVRVSMFGNEVIPQRIKRGERRDLQPRPRAYGAARHRRAARVLRPRRPAFVEHAADILANVNRADRRLSRSRPAASSSCATSTAPDGSDAGRMGDFSAPDEDDSFVAGTPRVELVPGLHVRSPTTSSS